MRAYNEKLSPEDQVDMEEKISQVIMFMQEDEPLTDEDCNELGRHILYKILEKFRSDLMEDEDV